MERLRLAVITRHFWPHFGPYEMAISDVATAIVAAGHQVELLTIRWNREWARSFQFREFTVTRITRHVSGPWGLFRYLRALNRHSQLAELDGMIVFGLQGEAWAAIRHFADRLPVVVFVDQQSLKQKNSVHRNSRKMSILARAKKIWVDSSATAAELVVHYALDPGLVSIVPPAVRIETHTEFSKNTKSQTKARARTALSDAHPILRIDPEKPLVLCGASRFEDYGMDDLVESWCRVLDRFPSARLWVLGDGFKARRLWERICELRLADSIIMPGFFDDWEDLLAAADLYVHPLRETSVCPGLVRALAAGVCCVTTQSEPVQSLVEGNVNGLLVPPEHPAALAEAIAFALDDPLLRERLGAAAQDRALQRLNIDRQVQDLIQPFWRESLDSTRGQGEADDRAVRATDATMPAQPLERTSKGRRS